MLPRLFYRRGCTTTTQPEVIAKPSRAPPGIESVSEASTHDLGGRNPTGYYYKPPKPVVNAAQ